MSEINKEEYSKGLKEYEKAVRSLLGKSFVEIKTVRVGNKEIIVRGWEPLEDFMQKWCSKFADMDIWKVAEQGWTGEMELEALNNYINCGQLEEDFREELEAAEVVQNE